MSPTNGSLTPMEWPNQLHFEKDPTCQRVFKPFILSQLHKLKHLDEQRPPDITYIFHEHALRVAIDVRKTCLHLGLSKRVAENMYWATLPHDIGKINIPLEIWDFEEKPDERIKTMRRSHTDLGAEIVNKEIKVAHPFKDLMIDIMRNHHEQMDGGGYHGTAGDQLSLPVRLVSIVEAFDGWSIPRPHFGDRDTSVPAVLERMKAEKAHMFDPALFKAFAEVKLAQYNKTA